MKIQILKKLIINFSLVCFSLLIAFFILEKVLSVYYIRQYSKQLMENVTSEKLFTLLRSNAWEIENVQKFGCSSFASMTGLDPYVGWLPKLHPDCKSEISLHSVNEAGLHGPELPLKKSKSQFSVMLIGGSVAHGLGMSRLLESELKKIYPDKNVVIINGAYGGWSHPQQFNLFVMHAPRIDAVIAFDGYNEHWKFYPKNKVMFENPGQSFELNLMKRTEWKTFLGVAFSHKILEILDKPLCQKLYSCFFLIEKMQHAVFRLFIEKSLANDDLRDIRSRYSYPRQTDDAEFFHLNLEKYKYYIRLIGLISKEMKIPYAHFIQPVPLMGKELSPIEKTYAGTIYQNEKEFLNIYQRLCDGLMKLKNENIPIYNLRDVFNNSPQTVYTDNIHLNSLGNQIVAEKMAHIISGTWKLR